MKDFAATRHEAWNTSSSIINSAVVRAVESPISLKTKVTLGEANEVYDVATESGRELIVRISRDDDKPFEREKWAIDHAREAEVPVPDILTIDYFTENGEEKSMCLESKLPGVPLSEIVNENNKNEYRDVFVKAGSMLSNIHSVVTPNGYGYINERAEGSFPTFYDYITKSDAEEDKLLRIAEESGQSTDIVTRALEYVKKSKNYFTSPPRLLHNDFSPKHILVNEGSITGIIDFAECRGGDPVYELARWDYYADDPQLLEWLKEGYTDKTIFDENFEEKMSVYKVSIGLSLLTYYEMVGGHENYAFHWEKINKELSKHYDL